TEATVGCSIWQVGEDVGEAAIPIGSPIANTTMYVLDDARRPVPTGGPGELYIGGAGLARGYLGQPEATAERFLDNPFGPGRIYRTGDLVRRRPCGAMEFLGRIDDEVKINGVRIHPAEIESALCAHPSIAEAVVTAASHTGGGRRLVAYY